MSADRIHASVPVADVTSRMGVIRIMWPCLRGLPGGFRLLTLAALLLAAACESPSSSSAALLPVVRFVDEPGRATGSPAEPQRVFVTLSGESRPVLFATWPELLLQTHIDEPRSGAELTYTVTLGAELRAAAQVFVEPLVGVGWDWHPQPVRVLGVDREKDEPIRITVRVPQLTGDKPVSVKIVGRVAPPLADLDVVTRAVLLPPDAELRFAAGAEEAAWYAPPVSVDLSVTALHGGDQSIIYRRRLDPAQNSADRAWHEERVSLAHLAGERVQFRFAARAADGTGTSSLPVWGDPAIVAPREEARQRPGVILISVDTLRAISLSTYGAERLTTPNLTERMGRRGVLFEHAIAPFSYTLPSHVSMFTGLYHRTHGVRGMFHRIRKEHRTLAEALRDAGYATAAVTDDGYLWGVSGIRRGFSLYAERTDMESQDPLGPIAETFRRGLRWLRLHADQPFFLFLHTYQVHHPHRPTSAYQSYFVDPASTSSDIERIRLRYEQEIRAADDAIGTLLDELARLGVAENTLLIITSDHGEEFLEHGERFHGKHLYDEVLRVPLFVRLPGVIPANHRVTTPVSLVDLTPTILDLLDLPPFPDVEGQSLVPLLQQGEVPTPPRVLFAEALSRFHATSVDVLAARSATHKCILQNGQHECYDLVTDPDERHALALDGSNEAVAQLLERLDGFQSEQSPEPSSLPAGELDPTKVEKLRALGYVE